MTSYMSRAARGAVFVLIFSALASLIGYFTRIVLARNLTPEEYGLFYAVFTFVIFFLFFRDLGLGAALVKYVSEWRVLRKFNRIKAGIIFVFAAQWCSSLIIGSVFWLLSGYLSEHYFKNPQSAVILKILLLYVFFSILFILTKQIFQSFQRMFLYATMELMKNLAVLLSILVFLKMKYTALAPAFAFALVGPVLFALYLPFLLQTFNFFKFRTAPYSKVSRKLFYFGIPVLLTDVGAQIIGYMDTLILIHYRSLAEVGIYNVVLPSALMFVFLSKAITAVMFPIVSELWAKKDKERLAQGINLVLRYTYVLLLPIISTGIIFSSFLIDQFFGKNYVAGSFALKILLVGVLLYVVASANHAFLSGIGKPKTVTVIIFGAAAINAGINVLLIPRYGINGAAFATSCSYLFMSIVSTKMVVKELKNSIKSPFRNWLKLILPGTLFFFIQWTFEKKLNINPWFEIFISIITAGIVYVWLLLILKIINIHEIRHYAAKLIGRENELSQN